jgi:hypothetical protein
VDDEGLGFVLSSSKMPDEGKSVVDMPLSATTLQTALKKQRQTPVCQARGFSDDIGQFQDPTKSVKISL